MQILFGLKGLLVTIILWLLPVHRKRVTTIPRFCPSFRCIILPIFPKA